MRMFETIGAIFVAVLPRRYWPRFDWMPIHVMAPVSGALTALAGTALGIVGFFAYLEQVKASPATSILEIAGRQVAGTLPETAEVSAVPFAISIVSPIAFAFFTPLGLFSVYLVASGWLRVASWWVAEPHGDPVLTGLDWLARRTRRSAKEGSVRRARLGAEGAEEPDRLYPGTWASLPDVDLVVVASRRKPGWQKGTFVITPDGWYTLGAPFDRHTAHGLRTVYPLTLQKENAVLRKGVSYQLPPLRKPEGLSPRLPGEG
ncbi:MAG: hypothetical protein Q7R30_01195 [Acidobacteriota bacterium]|nr:hypothetical protein [Acidobacteriota bacterium]